MPYVFEPWCFFPGAPVGCASVAAGFPDGPEIDGPPAPTEPLRGPGPTPAAPQSMNHLLDNAVKTSPPGPYHPCQRFAGARRRTAKLLVRSRRPWNWGMTRRAGQESVFEKFRPAVAGHPWSPEGTGRGLSSYHRNHRRIGSGRCSWWPRIWVAV